MLLNSKKDSTKFPKLLIDDITKEDRFLERYTLKKLVTMLHSRDISSHEILDMYMQRISDHDKSLNCYITLNKDAAIEKSIQADRLIKSGDSLPLTGIPYAGKDLSLIHI